MLSPINSYKINLCILILIYPSGVLLWNGRECQFSRWHLEDSGTAEPFLLHACLLLPFILGKIHIHAVLLFCALRDLLKHPPLLWRLSWLLEHWVGPSTANGSWNNRPTIYLVQCGKTCAGAAGVYEVWISLRKNRSRLSPLKVAPCVCVYVCRVYKLNKPYSPLEAAFWCHWISWSLHYLVVLTPNKRNYSIQELSCLR